MPSRPRWRDLAETDHHRDGLAGVVGAAGPGPGPHDDLQLLRRVWRRPSPSTRSDQACSPPRSWWPRSRSAWSAPSPRGTSRSSSPPPSWRRPWPPVARSSSSRRPRPRSTPSGWPRSSPRPGCPRASSRSLPAGREVGEHLVTHPGVDKVSFTGSSLAGQADRRALRRAPQALHPRTGREVGGHHPRRRRPRPPPCPTSCPTP